MRELGSSERWLGSTTSYLAYSLLPSTILRPSFVLSLQHHRCLQSTRQKSLPSALLAEHRRWTSSPQVLLSASPQHIRLRMSVTKLSFLKQSKLRVLSLRALGSRHMSSREPYIWRKNLMWFVWVPQTGKSSDNLLSLLDCFWGKKQYLPTLITRAHCWCTWVGVHLSSVPGRSQ